MGSDGALAPSAHFFWALSTLQLEPGTPQNLFGGLIYLPNKTSDARLNSQVPRRKKEREGSVREIDGRWTYTVGDQTDGS